MADVPMEASPNFVSAYRDSYGDLNEFWLERVPAHTLLKFDFRRSRSYLYPPRGALATSPVEVLSQMRASLKILLTREIAYCLASPVVRRVPMVLLLPCELEDVRFVV